MLDRRRRVSLLQLFAILHTEDIVQLTPRTTLRLEKLLASRPDWTVPRLAESAAALLATDEATWRRVHDRLTALLTETDALASTDPADDAPKRPADDAPLPLLPPGSERPAPGWRARLSARLRGLRGVTWVAILGLTTIIIVVQLVLFSALLSGSGEPAPDQPGARLPRPASTSQALPGTPATETRPDPAPRKRHRLELADDSRAARDVRTSDAQELQISKDGWFLGLLLTTAILLFLGLGWVAVPQSHRDHRERQRKRAREERARLAREDAGTDVPYHIERHPPFAEAAMDDAATRLARLASHSGRRDLDVSRTLTATARAAGHLAPVFRPAYRSEPLLVLVDIERGDHPFLDAVDHVLRRWRTTGLSFVRYHYQRQPVTLRPAAGGPSVPLEQLGRSKAGAPLLLFSRMARPADYAGSNGWLRRLAPWPARALIDLDPRPRRERDQDVRRALTACVEARLPCYPFSPAGLLAAACALAGEPTPAPDRPSLPSVDELRPALRFWAALGAYVPDPGWRQLESLRQAFPELHRSLPSQAHVQRLIEWLYIERPEYDPMSQIGRLDIELELGTELIGELRQRDQERASRGEPRSDDPGPVEERARTLIMRQLASASPISENQRKLRDLKLGYHQAMLDHKRLPELIARFAGSPHEPELRAMLRQEMKLQEHTPDGTHALSGRPRDAVDDLLRERSVVPLARVLRPDWRRPRALTVAVGLLAVAVSWTLVLAFFRPEAEVSRPAYLPHSWKLVSEDRPPAFGGLQDAPSGKPIGRETALARTDAPMTLIQLSGGEFTMGSPDGEGESNEHPQRRVRLSPFAICQHEVTQQRWRLVMGNDPPGGYPFGRGDGLPVHSVNWFDALSFLDALSKLEGYTPCYADIREGNPQPATWTTGCTGYRLPTEAEWEYATRAGTSSRYSFGDSAEDLDDYAWHLANTGSKLEPVGRKKPNMWGLHDVHGSIWEWTWDRYDRYPSGSEADPTGPRSGGERVLRGGSFVDSAVNLRSAVRYWGPPSHRYGGIGFRCARGVPPASTP